MFEDSSIVSLRERERVSIVDLPELFFPMNTFRRPSAIGVCFVAQKVLDTQHRDHGNLILVRLRSSYAVSGRTASNLPAEMDLSDRPSRRIPSSGRNREFSLITAVRRTVKHRP